MVERNIRELEVCGFAVSVDDVLGHLWVAHDGTITWEQLLEIKTKVWGADARAIEVYPAESNVVNHGNFRHLWRLAPFEFCPDLLGEDGSQDTLAARHAAAWAKARRST